MKQSATGVFDIVGKCNAVPIIVFCSQAQIREQQACKYDK